MKVLVTGAAGYIGSYVARALLWRGDDVVGLDNFNFYYPRNCKEFHVDLCHKASGRKTHYFSGETIDPVYKKLKGYFDGKKAKEPGQFSFYEADITNYEFLEYIFTREKPDAVIHLAAMAGVPFSTKQPRVYSSVNVDGTTNLLNLCKEVGTNKFIFASSSSVYGDMGGGLVTEKDDVTRAVSIYGATKVAGESISHAAHAIYGINCVNIRIFGPIYGPLQRPYGMFLPRAINFIRNNKIMQIYGRKGLETAKDSTYIDDLVDGLLLALDSDVKFDVFNIGTQNPQSIQQWLDAVEKAYGEPVKYKIVDVDVADVASSASIAKARKILGYSPKATLEEGVKRQVEVFKMMPEWYQTMDNV
ncbi:NAD-dependent epimerase/dehydratase family protein [bacterium]|nr:NAD-dependent epimerase/dehydratase family protein [bacterium]